jgi:arylsulfatase A-like enzyme
MVKSNNRNWYRAINEKICKLKEILIIATMKYNHVLFAMVLTLAVIKLSGQKESGPYLSPSAPNILCIMVDDLGFGDLSCQGANDLLTPHIDQLAEQGMRMTQFYANCTVCSPSRASLLTGRYPDMVGVPGVIRQFENDSWGYLDPGAVLIPEPLNQQGYHTAIIGKWHLGFKAPNTPNDRGFDYFKGFLGDMMDDYWTHQRGGVNWMRFNQVVIDPEGHATDLFTDWTLEYLEERAEDKQPFFLYLAYNAPHFPIQPPDEFLVRVKERDPGLSEKRAKNVAFIEHLDHHVGRVMTYLDKSGLMDNTLVVFTSDNGGAIWYEQSNGPLRGGKQDMYEGGIRVPAFVVWKGNIKPGSSSDRLTLLMDLFPTFAEITGAELSSSIDGESFLPELKGEVRPPSERTVFWVRREGNIFGGQAYYAARRGDYKILQNTPYEPIQFFNVGEDPYEQVPLETVESEIYQSLRSALQEHIQETGRIPWQKQLTD